jgi:Protein of unknown function (DUF4238)
MNAPRAHHYLPVFYLKGFTSPYAGRLSVYEKGKPLRKSTPVNEAHRRDLYSFEDEQGHHRDFEKQLSKSSRKLHRYSVKFKSVVTDLILSTGMPLRSSWLSRGREGRLAETL